MWVEFRNTSTSERSTKSCLTVSKVSATAELPTILAELSIFGPCLLLKPFWHLNSEIDSGSDLVGMLRTCLTPSNSTEFSPKHSSQ